MTGENNTTDDVVVADSETGAPEATDETTGTDSPDNSQESDKDEADTTKEEGTKPEVDEEPPTRKPRTNADWVALRRQQKLEKQASRKDEQGEDEEGEDDDVSPEDAAIIDKVVAKRLEPILQEREQEGLKTEINSFIEQNPDFKKFADKALKWAVHPSWKNVPTEQLMYAVAGKDLLTIGAKRREEADKKANATRMGGNSSQGSGTAKPVWEMTDAEFEQEVIRVKTGA